ncbi:uncharacterized protein LOC133830305 isoform X2 [Humulus lupulus]|uniref:uncharacterized protein LOC133830305 isoform X2 n=1 Tax=Humulus lupulus TaxID=3486 RepID=UPI002B4015F0|nr:uncharacterized protein LOC133830305 isoform X2 [Humulus lupulus]
MINGEPSDSFLLLRDQLSDDGDACSSRYSSCGESEFDRYCSANSVMGTPSMCSTVTVFNDFGESEFGSLRNSGFGEETGGLENFSLGGKGESSREEIKSLGDRKIEFCNVNSMNYGSSGFELYGDDEFDLGAPAVNELMSWKVEGESSSALEGVSGFENGLAKGDSGETLIPKRGVEEIGVTGENKAEQMCTQETNNSVFVGSDTRISGEVEKCCLDPIASAENESGFDGLKPESFCSGDMKERERQESQEDNASSRNEDSEVEDSMYNYGADDEDKSGYNYQRNELYRQEAKVKNENPLHINSSVAFGSDDWDDFVQESGGTQKPLDLFTMNAFQNQAEKNNETKRELLDSSPATSVGFSINRQTEKGKNLTEMPVSSNQLEGDYTLDDIVNNSEAAAHFLNFSELEDVKDISVASCQVQGSPDLTEITKSLFTTTPSFPKGHATEQEKASPVSRTINQVGGVDELAHDPNKFGLDPLEENFAVKTGYSDMDNGMSQTNQNAIIEESISINDSGISKNRALGNSKIKLDPLDDKSAKLSSHSNVPSRNMNSDFLKDYKPKTDLPSFGNNVRKSPPVSEGPVGTHPAVVKTDDLELDEFYDEVVLEMEEILLDSSESPGAWFPHSNRGLQSHLSLPLRDGGSSASTSGKEAEDAHPLYQQPLRIDDIEVVGARQKKGDISFSERLVGVKEYTVYKIRVLSGKDQWEVERRYRDFFTLYRRLKTLCASQGWTLPSIWASVEKESRKIFGNASPDVVSERSILIQECLRSIIHPKFFNTSPSALIWFLCPQDSVPSSPGSNLMAPRSTSRGNGENISTLGKTIALIVEIQPYKSMKQMLEAQHYTCAGCYKHFDDEKTLIRDFAQTFGWGKPRLCEYTSQLFCSSCHTNETAVLPARVLHNWDFMEYPVSQLAKSYLDSIHDQPMLCVSAVNPFLFSKVPALLHVMGVRRKIGSILSYVHCSFKGSINKGLGSRRYLLESNDFFALRDLIDLSKGAFAVLPVMVETVLKKILEHITEQCLVCCDAGVPCSARQACNDPSSLIFPFQEGDVEKCPSCESVFHKHCFKKLTDCPCGAHLRIDDTRSLTKRVSRSRASGDSSGALDLFGKGLTSGLNVGFLSGLFAKAKPDNLGMHKNSDNVILMGSMPSTSL